MGCQQCSGRKVEAGIPGSSISTIGRLKVSKFEAGSPVSIHQHNCNVSRRSRPLKTSRVRYPSIDNPLQKREGNDIPYGWRISQQHAQSIQAHAHASCGRQSILQRLDEVLIKDHLQQCRTNLNFPAHPASRHFSHLSIQEDIPCGLSRLFEDAAETLELPHVNHIKQCWDGPRTKVRMLLSLKSWLHSSNT